jgi:hypothetical protein
MDVGSGFMTDAAGLTCVGWRRMGVGDAGGSGLAYRVATDSLPSSGLLSHGCITVNRVACCAPASR